jgi:PAS domain S-box-containing protein
LRSSEVRFRQTFELAASGIAHVDLQGRFTRVNRSLCRILGRSASDMAGRTVKEFSHPEDRDVTDAARQRMRDGIVETEHFEKRYLHSNGEVVWVDLTVALVRDGAGEPEYEIAVFDDITVEVQARMSIERMNSELENRVDLRTTELREAMKELDAFTYSVSHDLRAPIGAVSGFAHLLRSAESERLSEDGRRLLGFIEQNAERMTRLIEGLLRFSRLGRSELRRSRVSMNGLVAESLMDFVDEAARADIRSSAMPDCSGDEALLGQVWSNLLGNALKYSRGAKVPVLDIGWDAAKTAYFIRDNGVGFDMAYAGKLFGVFERLHAESEFEGSGIGLAIAERIVRLHGGAIGADAAPGQGATFWFTVPAVEKWEN